MRTPWGAAVSSMKVLCLIDSLGSGGAQRQLCTLACLLKKRGMDVSVLTYHPHHFFLPLLQEAGVEYACLAGGSWPRRIWSIRRMLRRGDQDVVLAFLSRPVFYAELAAIPFRQWGLVVSERNAVPAAVNPRLARWRQLHRIADFVTTNSHTNRLMIERDVPSLKGRVVTIYNAVDLETFTPAPTPSGGSAPGFHVVVAARYESQKNPSGLVEAVALAKKKAPSMCIQLDWYGHYGTAADRGVFRQAQQLVERHGLQECVRLHGESQSILAEYGKADVVALPSFFEGLPNTLCEAMACGRPILTSNVCDAGNLVKSGENGFLFNPTSPEDMAMALLKFGSLTPAQREAMGRKSREMAERMFNPVNVAAAYEKVLTASAERKKISIEHWTPDVPDSARLLPT